MLELKRCNKKFNLEGFVVKKGYWYGEDTELNQKVVFSGGVDKYQLKKHADNDLWIGLYFYRPSGQWEFDWVNLDEGDYLIEDADSYEKIKNPISFDEWVDNQFVSGISTPESAYAKALHMQYSLMDQYNQYLYGDKLPIFAVRYIIAKEEAEEEMSHFLEFFSKF